MDYKERPDVTFFEKDSITCTGVTMLGLRYTTEEFIAMLKLMKYGIHLYPDNIIHLESAQHIGTEEATVKGYVAVRGFAPAETNEDPRLVFMTDSFESLLEQVNGFTVKSLVTNLHILFTDAFVNAIRYLIETNESPLDLGLIQKDHKLVAIQDTVDKLMNCHDDLKIYDDGRKVALVALEHRFQIVYKHHYCATCETFDTVKKYPFTKKVPLTKTTGEGIVDTGEFTEKKTYLYLCNACHNKAVKHRTTVNNDVKIGRNDPCLCGSGKKYKKCCG